MRAPAALLRAAAGAAAVGGVGDGGVVSSAEKNDAGVVAEAVTAVGLLAGDGTASGLAGVNGAAAAGG